MSYEEIFGFEVPKLPIVKAKGQPVPDLPMDDPLWEFTPASGKHTDAMSKIQDAAFVSELLGDTPTPETALADSPALVEYHRIKPITFTETHATASAALDLEDQLTFMKEATGLSYATLRKAARRPGWENRVAVTRKWSKKS